MHEYDLPDAVEFDFENAKRKVFLLDIEGIPADLTERYVPGII